MSKGSAKARTARQAKIAAAQKGSRSGPSPIVIGTVVAIVAIVAVIAFVVLTAASKNSGSSGTAVPTGAAGMGKGLVVNADVALVPGAPTVDIYEDFQCPLCGDFERGLGSTVESLAAAGKIKLVYHVMTFLDGNLGNDSSVRASEGAFCANAAGKFLAFHNQVFANQPAQEGAGWTDAQLTTFATNAGISGQALTTWTSCTTAKTYAAYLDSIEKQANADKVTGTPTLRINGVDHQVITSNGSSVQVQSAADFTAAIEAATKP